jgi:long-chain acyl-CoA synthetase
VLQYTGGTTGISKGCALTNFNLVAMALQTAEWMKPVVEGRAIRTLAAIPLYHVYGFNLNVNINMFAGGAVVLIPKPTPDALLEAINAHQPTLFPAVPTMLIDLIHHPAVKESKIDLIKSVTSGGAPLTRETMTVFEELSETRIMEGYGLSEVSNVVTGNPHLTKRKKGSIGVPWPDVDVKVVKVDDGTTMAVGEPGELLVKTPTLMSGYWNNPSETENTIRDGWLHTGDVAYQDEDGFIFIVGRKKDMILASGFNIYPREIDEVMYTHPKVLHSCTVGVPDPKRGETVKVFLQLKERMEMDEGEVVRYCRERLTAYKVPKIVEFIDEVPLTSVGKPDRKALKERG